MCRKSWRIFLLSFCIACITACGNDGGSESTESASISGINFEGGELSTVFAAGETQYTLNVLPFATSFSLNLTLPEGVTATAFAANGADDAEPSEISIGEDNILTFALGSEVDHLLISVEGDAYEDTLYVFRIVQLGADEFAQITELSIDFADVLSEMIDDDDGALGDIILNGNQYAVGVPEYDGEDAEGSVLSNSGAIFILTPAADDSDDSWDIEMIQSPSPTAGDRFGDVIAFEENFLFISAPNEDGDADSTLEVHNDSAANSGAVYGFTYNETTNQWGASYYLKSPNVGRDNSFGYAIALWISHDGVVDLSVAEDFAYVTHVFTRSSVDAAADSPTSDTFSLTASWRTNDSFANILLSSDFWVLIQPNNAVDFDGDGIAHGSVGQVYVQKRQSDGTFNDFTISDEDEFSILSGSAENERFGTSFAIDGNRLAIGNVLNQVKVYIFDEETNSWDEEQSINGASNTVVGDRFGASVALHGSLLAIGATGNDGDATTTIDTTIDATAADHVNDSGALYLYRAGYSSADQSDDLWEFDAYRKEANAQADAMFGAKVTLLPAGQVMVYSPTEVHVFQ